MSASGTSMPPTGGVHKTDTRDQKVTRGDITTMYRRGIQYRRAAHRRRTLLDPRVPVSLLLTGDPVADALTADEAAGVCRRPCATDDLMAIADALTGPGGRAL